MGDLVVRILGSLRDAGPDAYPNRRRIPQQRILDLSITKNVGTFFDAVCLDYVLSPDFSAVLQKARGVD